MPEQELPFLWFSYMPVPSETQPIHVEWQLLKSADVERDHIRVHELVEEELARDGEGLLAILQKYQVGHAKAVVLINTDETLALPESARNKLGRLAGYPMVMITRSNGDQLLGCLNMQCEDEELHIQLVVESVDVLEECDIIEGDVELTSSSTSSRKHESHKGEYQRPSQNF